MTSNLKRYSVGVGVASTSADGSATVIYTCPNNFVADLVFLRYANKSASAQLLSLEIYHAEDTEYHYLMYTESVAAYTSGKVIDNDRLVMHPGDKIVAYADSADKFEIVIGVEESRAQFTFVS